MVLSVIDLGSQAQIPSVFCTFAWGSRLLLSGPASAGCAGGAWPLFPAWGCVTGSGKCSGAVGPEPKRQCHQSPLSIMAQVFGKCHGAGLFNPVACSLSAGLGFLVKFTVQANIDCLLQWKVLLCCQRDLQLPGRWPCGARRLCLPAGPPLDRSIFAPAQPTEKGREGRRAFPYSSQGQTVCSCWNLDKVHPPGGDLSAVGGPRSS